MTIRIIVTVVLFATAIALLFVRNDFVATVRFSAIKTKSGIQLINFVRNRHP
ncbi:hypothetical protein AGMMS4952_09540 [Spirochaetia bacterium]|nr:hypothetical protein AGMMS4952_09540 [Spirochaetia bacterium]